MGIQTVAVYSEADARSLHVQEADEAVLIGKSRSAESYLVSEKIVDAGLKTGCQAIHPGYGFLSENAGFCQKVGVRHPLNNEGAVDDLARLFRKGVRKGTRCLIIGA